ncbi:MAG: M28 family peptidase [Opitutaceae bacterium]|nr:M28 family peptidase [Opitutaceae bacterium]
MPPSPFNPTAVRGARIARDWQVLCGDIGERRAGTPAEARAAAYIAARLEAAGCAEVRTETFPCASLRSSRVRVAARAGGRWRPVPATILAGAPGTPRVEGELAWLEMPENAPRLRPGSLRGRVAALFGPLPTSEQHHRRLVAAAPAAVIQIDERLPFPWLKSDGVFPHWTRTFGMPPVVTIPYTDAWRWRRDGVRRVRVEASARLVAADSQNVIAELPGADPRLPAILLTAHHDTQAANVGADDNASGVVSVLELARVLAPLRRRRTLRLISFGTEEQLSVGSAAYVRAHRRAAAAAGLVVNFDSVASPLGHCELSCIGTDGLARHASGRLAARGLDVVVRREVTPFVDNFPFNWAGVPSLWFMRTNSPGGRWQHHSVHDNLDNVSVAEVVRLLRAVGPLVQELAATTRWPFAPGLPAAERAAARRLGRELFGLRT